MLQERALNYLGIRVLRWVCSASLVVCVLIAFGTSLHWPLIGDASLMHYVVCLQHRGLVPYRDIVDINMPGTYFFEAAAMRGFGEGALGLRLYDGFLLLATGTAAFLIAGKRSRFGGLFAAAIFALVHLQDGLAQGGQRNLLMAVLLLCSYAALYRDQTMRTDAGAMAFAGLCLGSIITIKPVLIPLVLVLLVTPAWSGRRSGRDFWKPFAAGAMSFFLPLAAMLVWLRVSGAWQAFWQVCHGLLPLHARLGRQSVAFLAGHCFSPIAILVALWILLFLVRRPRVDAGRAQLLFGIALTALAYLLEGKGYPYQRYPLLAMLLLVIGLDLDAALRAGPKARALAIAIAGLGALVLAPRFAWLTTTFNPQAPLQEALAATLATRGDQQALDGQVQCLDTLGGCINVLYNLRVRQSTGFLYDCYLYGDPSDARDSYRAEFLSALQTAKPRILIETDQFCFGNKRDYSKVQRWPALETMLDGNYRLDTEWASPVLQHWWARKEEPNSFRIYVRRAE